MSTCVLYSRWRKGLNKEMTQKFKSVLMWTGGYNLKSRYLNRYHCLRYLPISDHSLQASLKTCQIICIYIYTYIFLYIHILSYICTQRHTSTNKTKEVWGGMNKCQYLELEFWKILPLEEISKVYKDLSVFFLTNTRDSIIISIKINYKSNYRKNIVL